MARSLTWTYLSTDVLLAEFWWLEEAVLGSFRIRKFWLVPIAEVKSLLMLYPFGLLLAVSGEEI